jgi:2-iminobutanoate/2-iminopropanoate deaminase
MKREVIHVEPLSTYFERWKAPTSAVTRHGGTVYVSGFPPFDPATGEVIDAPIERQAELVLEQMSFAWRLRDRHSSTCSSTTSIARRSRNSRPSTRSTPAISRRTHPRIFVNVPAWPGHFDIEIDCIAAVADKS